MHRCVATLLIAFAFANLPAWAGNAATAEIEIYTASYCGECRRAKAYMHEKRITFEEWDVEKDIERRREFYFRGGKGVPYIFVRGQALHGFDVEQFERLRGTRN